MWSFSVVIIQGGATAAIVIVVISFIELLVCKEGLYLLCILFLVYYNGQLKFVNKGSKIV
jgi:hypothetical protein